MVRVAQHVWTMTGVDAAVVATDDERVAAVVRAAGLPVELTSPAHPSGTDRVAEVAARPAWQGFAPVVNVQGDEPFLPAEAVAGALARVAEGDDIGTAAAPLDPALAHDPGRVKVVTDGAGRALYFSRAAIPHVRDGAAPAGTYWQHLGVYAFGRAALARWAQLAPTALEEVERLEQLRPLEHGFRIGVARLTAPAPPGIDTPEDLLRAQARWHQTHEALR